MKDLRIVFMGTPEFAVETLATLLKQGCNVIGVVTVPDKPSGRGRKLNKSAVKEFAEANGLHPVLQPESLKDPGFITDLGALRPDIIVVVAFRLLPEVVWRLPSGGTFNLHASLLPDYRGAAPINHVIINGETMTGVTTFLIDEHIDTGNILLQEKLEILPAWNAGDIHDRLMVLGAGLVVRTLEGLSSGTLVPRPQTEFVIPGKTLSPAPRIFPKDCVIDWSRGTVTIQNLIRGLSPYPAARSALRKENTETMFRIFESRIENWQRPVEPGTIITDGKEYFMIACADGLISILNLQLEGRKRMNAREFLMGFRLPDYTISLSWQV